MKKSSKGKPEKNEEKEESHRIEKNEKERERYQANKPKILKAKKEAKTAIASRECEKRHLPTLLAPYISFLCPKGDKKDRMALHFGTREELLDFIIIILKSDLTKEKVMELLYIEEKLQREKEASKQPE